MHIIGTIIIGLLVGIVAKLLMPVKIPVVSLSPLCSVLQAPLWRGISVKQQDGTAPPNRRVSSLRS